LEYEKAKTEHTKITNQITYEVDSVLDELIQAKREIKAAQHAKEANRRVLSRENDRYEMAKIDNQDFLRAQNSFYEAEQNYLRAIINYKISLVKLQWAKGSIITDFGFSLQFSKRSPDPLASATE